VSDPSGRPAAPVFDDDFRARFDALLRWRRDVRRFRRDPVDPPVAERLIAAAALAPSVGYSQPWRFVTVADPRRRAAVRRLFETANAAALARQPSHDRAARYARLKLSGLDEAPWHLAVFVDPDPEAGHGLGRATMPETVAYSAVMAVHTLWLAARAEGLGMGWVSIIDPEAVRALLDVPAEWRLVGYFCIGRPAGEHDTPELERAGWETRRETVHLLR